MAGWAAAFAVCLLPALTLTVRGSANRILLVLLLLCAIGAALNRQRAPHERFGALARQYGKAYFAMASLLLSAIVSTLVWNSGDASALDTPTRLAVFGLVFYAAMGAPQAMLRLFQWGCVAGALLAASMLAVALQANDGTRPLQVGFTNLLAFSNIALLLGLFSFLSTGWSNWQSRVGQVGVILKLTAGTAGLLASYASGSRGGWLALPLLALVSVLLYRCAHRRKLFIVVIGAAALFSAFQYSPVVQDRAMQGMTEFSDYFAGRDLDSSVGTRLQLWKAAWLTFLDNPVFGVSRQNYQSAMAQMAERGVLTPQAAGFGHSHNEILYSLATLGLLGALSMLAIWLVPAVLYARAACSDNPDKRVAGAMGLFLTLGFMVFGFTEVMFTVSMVAAFYTIVNATLLAIIAKADAPARVNPA